MKPRPGLVFCLLMDLIGSLSFFFPGIGEWFDIAWAPLSAFIFYKSFGGKVGRLGSVISFIEEILPYTDILPTFTIAYFYNRFKRK